MTDWRPTAPLDNIKARAELNAQIRAFFAARNVVEVETPLLSRETTTDVHLHSFAVPQADGSQRYLQTSPEFAMKRLLAAGSGAIYQLGKAFRYEEDGRRHNPEFTMLEWYQSGYDLQRLMDEVAELVGEQLGLAQVERLSYRELFNAQLGLDPWLDADDVLRQAVQRHIDIDLAAMNTRDDWLDLLMSHVVEPQLGHGKLTFIYGYPPSQASLARTFQDDSGATVAARFELYVNGIELANGYHELVDAAEQRTRFMVDIENRQREGLTAYPLPENLLAALDAGLPDCAGVALGVDRLLMLKLAATSLDQVINFPYLNA